MPNIIDQIETTSGLAVMNYKTQANLPQSDKGLTQDGGFADGAVTGERINRIQNILTDENGELIQNNIITNIKNIEKIISDKETGHGKLIDDNAQNIKVNTNSINQLKESTTNSINQLKESTANSINELKELISSDTETQNNAISQNTTDISQLKKSVFGLFDQQTTDWNNTTTTGCYYSSGESQNLPNEISEIANSVIIYGHVQTYTSDHIEFIHQVIYCINEFEEDWTRYERTYLQKKDSWTPWVNTTFPTSNFTDDEINSIFISGTDLNVNSENTAGTE